MTVKKFFNIIKPSVYNNAFIHDLEVDHQGKRVFIMLYGASKKKSKIINIDKSKELSDSSVVPNSEIDNLQILNPQEILADVFTTL